MLKNLLKEKMPFFMETSALESMEVENAFTEVLAQIHYAVSRKALEASDNPTALPKGQTINFESKDDVSAVKTGGCCSTWQRPISDNNSCPVYTLMTRSFRH